MKIILGVLGSIVSVFFSTSNIFDMDSGKKEIDFNSIKIEVKWFIEKAKEESFDQGRYNVYAVKIYQGDYSDQYCVTIGYFEDSLLISHTEGFKYYMHIEEDLILLDYSNDFKNKYEFQNASEIQLLTDRQIITSKINKEEVSIGTFAGYVCCYEEGIIQKIYYEDSDEIPYDKSIFKFSPLVPGTLIELDSSSFKQILKDKQQRY